MRPGARAPACWKPAWLSRRCTMFFGSSRLRVACGAAPSIAPATPRCRGVQSGDPRGGRRHHCYAGVQRRHPGSAHDRDRLGLASARHCTADGEAGRADGGVAEPDRHRARPAASPAAPRPRARSHSAAARAPGGGYPRAIRCGSSSSHTKALAVSSRRCSSDLRAGSTESGSRMRPSVRSPRLPQRIVERRLFGQHLM